MDVSTTSATLMIIGGLIGLILLRVLDASSYESAAADLKHARRKLKAVTTMLKQHQRGRAAPIAPAQVRDAIESIAGCTRILRRTANDSHAAALASIERSVVLLSSVLDSVTQEAPKLHMQKRRDVRARS